MNPVRINLSQLTMTAGTQLRAKADEATIAEYAEHLKHLPPIDVFFDGTQYIPADGFHRIAAFKMAGEQAIPCIIHNGTIRDAVRFAAGCNSTHGLRRTNEDKRRAIEAILRDTEWARRSNRWIADVVKVGHPLVASVRADMRSGGQVEELPPDEVKGPQQVQGRDGKAYAISLRSNAKGRPRTLPTRLQLFVLRLQLIESKASSFVELCNIGAFGGDQDKVQAVERSVSLALIEIRKVLGLLEVRQ